MHSVTLPFLFVMTTIANIQSVGTSTGVMTLRLSRLSSSSLSCHANNSKTTCIILGSSCRSFACFLSCSSIKACSSSGLFHPVNYFQSLHHWFLHKRLWFPHRCRSSQCCIKFTSSQWQLADKFELIDRLYSSLVIFPPQNRISNELNPSLCWPELIQGWSKKDTNDRHIYWRAGWLVCWFA